MNHKIHDKTRKAAIILFWLIVWQAAAVWIDNPILLVGPVRVLRAFAHNAAQPGFFAVVLSSLARIGLGFFLALFAGLSLGTVSYRRPVAEELLAPVMQTLKSIPVASFVVLLLIWFGSSRLSFFISFLIVFPNVYVNTIAGLKSADEQLLEMARMFDIGRWNCFFYIYRPALTPYLASCLKISLGMSWKSGVAAEVIGLPGHSVGERLYLSKIYLDTAGLFAWTLTVVLLSFFFEKAVLKGVRIFSEWKPYPKVRARRAVQQGDRNKSLHTDADKITISRLAKSYGGLRVLQDYDLTLQKGGRYLLMAPSGSGKTTLLRLLTGLDEADGGEVVGMPRRVGMVFQEDRLCEEYDALCNIMLGLGGWTAGPQGEGNAGTDAQTGFGRSAWKSGALAADRVRREAAKLLPEECLTKPVKELSGGMRRRVALLRAVCSASDMLVLDEPFAGLDEENRLLSAEYLLSNLGGRTLLVTTHRENDTELLRGAKVTLVFS